MHTQILNINTYYKNTQSSQVKCSQFCSMINKYISMIRWSGIDIRMDLLCSVLPNAMFSKKKIFCGTLQSRFAQFYSSPLWFFLKKHYVYIWNIMFMLCLCHIKCFFLHFVYLLQPTSIGVTTYPSSGVGCNKDTLCICHDLTNSVI